MLKILKLTVFAAFWFMSKIGVAAVPTDLITEMSATFEITKKSGEYLELVPETLWIWASKPDDAQKFAPIPIVKYQGEYYYNNPRSTKTWTNLQTSKESVAPEQFLQENLFVWMRDYAPIIEIGKVTDNSPIVYSAIECPACVELESKLSKSKKGYRVLPSTLKSQPTLEYRSIVCAANKAKSWVQAMVKREIDRPAPNDCDDQYRAVRLWSHLWDVYSFPTAIAPGAPVVLGIPKILDLFSIKSKP